MLFFLFLIPFMLNAWCLGPAFLTFSSSAMSFCCSFLMQTSKNLMKAKKVHMLCMQVSSCLPNHLLSGKEGPSFRVCGAFLLPNGVFLMHFSFMLCVFPLKVNMLMDSIVPSRLWWHVFLSQVVNLYGRCIIACANYTEYWIRYVLCMVMSTYGNMALAKIMLSLIQLKYLSRYGVSEACVYDFVLSFILVIACHGKLLVIALDLILHLCFLIQTKMLQRACCLMHWSKWSCMAAC